MGKIVFRIMGGYVLYFAAALVFVDILWVGHYSLRLTAPVTAAGLVKSGILNFSLGLLGVGLLFLRKWAALALSILALYPAFYSLRTATHAAGLGPEDANWLGFLYAGLLLTPSVLTAKYWGTLVWRAKSRTRVTTLAILL